MLKLGIIMLRRLYLLIVILNFVIPVIGQHYKFDNVTVSNGLSQSVITGIKQDNKGLIWVSTHDGLNSFDGYHFKIFRKDQSDNNSLDDFILRHIRFDYSGKLWLAGYHLSVFQSEKNRFIQYKNPYNTQVNKLNEIINFDIDKSGNIWLVYATSGMALFNVKSATYENIQKGKIMSFINDSLHSILIDKYNKLWIGTESSKILKIDIHQFYETSQLIFQTYRYTANNNNRIRPLYEDKDGRIWFTSESDKKLLLINNESDKLFDASTLYPQLKKVFKKETLITVVKQDFQDHIWIGTNNNGLFRLDPIKEELMQFVPNSDKNSILSFRIESVFEDAFGVLWIGTDKGISKLDLFSKKFGNNGPQIGNNTVLTNQVNSIYEDHAGDVFYAISQEGINTINKNKKASTNIVSGISNQHILVNNNIFSIAGYDDNFIITGGINLNIIDYKRKKFVYANPNTHKPTSISNWIIWKVHKGKKSGDFWIATMNGLNRLKYVNLDFVSANKPYALESGFEKFYHETGNSNSLISNHVWDVFEDASGMVYIATNIGLSIYDPKSKIFENHFYDSGNIDGLNCATINCIYEDKTGQIWLGTEGGGLNLYNKNTKKFTHFCEVNSVCGDVIWGILEDGINNLWISSTKGLYKFNLLNKTFNLYDESDGLQSNEFSRGAYFKNKNGMMYFGGVKGSTSFYPSEIKDNPFPPSIVLTNFFIYNESVVVGEKYHGDIVLKKSIQETDHIELNHHNKVISIEFAALHYVAPLKNQYLYMMEGFDKEWIKGSPEHRLAHYTNLPAGEYKFWVKASNCDGVWNYPDKPLLTIKVLPPFYLTWWFRGLLIVMILILAYLIFLFRVNQIEKQKEKLGKKVEEQLSEINEQKNELQIQQSILKEVNLLLKESETELKKQKSELQEINVLLEERQEEIMVQKEEIEIQSDKLKVQTDELLKLNATKDKFLSIIGHDLKNPFHAITGLSQLLLSNFEEMDSKQKLELISYMNEASTGASALLENLLLWARSQSGHINYNPAVFDLFEIINQNTSLLKANAESKNIKIINNLVSNTYVYADENMIHTIIRNLLNNAIKFTSNDGSIFIDCRQLMEEKEISINDTGVGMNSATLDQLFRIDVHHTSRGTKGETGTGLGLVICKEFIEKNNGKIWVESKLGEGSSFKFTLKNP